MNLKLLMMMICFSIAIFNSDFAVAQKKKKSKKGAVAAAPPAKKKKGPKKVADEIKKLKAIDGLFSLYRDSVNGSVKMVIDKEQINQEYIHWYYVENGVLEAGAFKGSFRGSKIFKIERYYDKIEFVTVNTSSYFDPENPLSKSADANISESILFSGKILAGSNEEGKFMIDADGLFLSEALGMVKFPSFSRNPNAFKLGNLSKSKTKYEAIKNYPENTNVEIEYVYENRLPRNGGSRAVTDARNISIIVQHSLIKVPDNDYVPRFDDARVGFFTTQVTDMTSTDVTPFRDLVHRWNLKKKDPNSNLSEPKEPIVWWIENTTPVEWRETIKEAVLEWNKSFEKAGFKNAVQVKVQPDDAEWDAGDIRYNVLRWTSSPNPPFGGYGPSFVNPRTGQILGADIMLEFVYHTNRVRIEKLFGFESNVKQEEIESYMKSDPYFCSYGEQMQENTLFGITALKARDASDLSMEGMKKEAMMELIMHEVGHTMGLNHNMKASQLYSPAQLYDKDFIAGKSLTGSVMDYAPINLSPKPETQGHYFSTTVGHYDNWAIEWGYSETNQAGLDVIANRSTDPKLIFGNDADDMRSPGSGIDPRVNTNDFSNDQITYSIDRIKIANQLMGELKSKYEEKGNTYQELLIAFFTTHGQYAGSVDIISRFIGGVYVDRALQGQEGGTKPYVPVPESEQKRAMKALKDFVFAPNAYDAPNELFNYLALQRRGYNFFGFTEDPKLHGRVLSSQRRVLDQLLHPNTLRRISDSELYGNGYSLSAFMVDLNDAIFKADAGGSVNSFRQNIQIEYTKRLVGILESKRQTNLAKSMALYNLKNIRRIALSSNGNVATRAHRQHLKLMIDNAMEK